MTTSIPALQATHARHGLLIDLEINGTTYRIANTYSPVTWNGNSYTQLGHLLGISEIQEDLRATNNSLTLSLSGIPSDVTGEPSYMSIVLDTPVKGSLVRIYRAFFSTTNGGLLADQVYLRFSGYVSNFSISENWDVDSRVMTNTISLSCSNLVSIIDKQYSGRRTNNSDQTYWFPGDTGMYRVQEIANTAFDFGKPYTPPAAPVSAPSGEDPNAAALSGGV